MCFGLKLNLEESLDLLDRAGYTLSSTSKRDLIIMSFIMNEKYDISELNDVLYSINLKLFPIV
ncbi:macro domain protein [Coprobacillus sp. CAG:698]|nr:macro domain protein [Coprobacillus sp. CAG:698]